MFDEKYFNDIWGTVHRHDYCEGLADTLIGKYGKVRFLDIGTGCGYLVKTLNERGAFAKGLEISQYAVDNSHGNVRQGSVLDIPYGQEFDVVFSQGLWCHVKEEDIDKAWAECNRVGKLQEHYIDYEEAPLDIPYFYTRKSEQWWKNRFYPKILIACPTHEVKEYAMQEWIDCVNKIDYPNFDIFVVDNSPTDEHYKKWKDKIPMEYLPNTSQDENASSRINASMQVIKKKFLEGDYKWWFNLEIDVIIPSDALNLMLKYPSDWTSHGYPARGGGGMMQGIGCSLLSRSIAEAGQFNSSLNGPDAELWELTMNTHKTISLTRFFDIKHIGKENGYGG